MSQQEIKASNTVETTTTIVTIKNNANSANTIDTGSNSGNDGIVDASSTTTSIGYRGKHFTVPQLSAADHIVIHPDASRVNVSIPMDEPIMKSFNKEFDIREFAVPHRPISLGVIPLSDRALFTRAGAPRVLDLPIKFPGSTVRLPKELEQFRGVVQQIIDFEMKINYDCYDEYYAYLTIDQHHVVANSLHREAPVHVDGFQGARWQPKVKNNHTYTVSDVLPTAYYPQAMPILLQLDESKHNFFWQMNAEVAKTNSAHEWHPLPWEITMMDCYCMHRGVEATHDVYRTWLRLSFEVRQFDRLGNAHNPAFRYQWPMVARDIEGLQLVAYESDMDASLRVFPWQRIDGTPHHDRTMKTKPNLKPLHVTVPVPVPASLLTPMATPVPVPAPSPTATCTATTTPVHAPQA